MNLSAREAVADAYKSDWGRIVATLIGLFNDFDLAEDVAQEAFAAAVTQWPNEGVPAQPRAWLIQTAKHKAIDRIRRRQNLAQKVTGLIESGVLATVEEPNYDEPDIRDDRLRLIFTCCHPALAPDARVALTLRTLCGLETDEIARAFLVPTATMAQRLVRAKRKIKDAGIPYKEPERRDLPERLEAVLTVIYLVFNEGYVATRGELLERADLSTEAIRLARSVRELMLPEPPAELSGLLALMLLHESRRAARLNSDGDIVILADQDRRVWDSAMIREALELVEHALAADAGPYGLQAGIAAEHCKAATSEETNWRRIVELYDRLAEIDPSPIVSLNRAVAVAFAVGARSGLALIDTLSATGELDSYHLLHAARADLHRRLGENAEAADSYYRALALVTNESERRFLQGRLSDVGGGDK